MLAEIMAPTRLRLTRSASVRPVGGGSDRKWNSDLPRMAEAGTRASGSNARLRPVPSPICPKCPQERRPTLTLQGGISPAAADSAQRMGQRSGRFGYLSWRCNGEGVPWAQSRTVGVEEELFLVDPETRLPSASSPRVLKHAAEHEPEAQPDDLDREFFEHQLEKRGLHRQSRSRSCADN